MNPSSIPSQPSTNTSSLLDVELEPSFKIPGVLIGVSIPLAWLQIWLGVIVGLFGLFLLLQAATIRLKFTATALDVYRSGRVIREFPYSEWAEWQIFWSPIPILFYFREVNSIHFLPMLFDAKQLRSCLEQHCNP